MTSVYTKQLTSKNLICYVKPISAAAAAATLPAFIKPKIIVVVDENHVNFCIFSICRRRLSVRVSVCVCHTMFFQYFM